MAIYHCRIRKYRKSAHLSQRELALLVGLHSQGAISDIEAGLKRPSSSVAFGCEVVFGVPARDLFPRLFRKAEADALKHARLMLVQMEHGHTRSATIASVAALIHRLGPTTSSYEQQA